MIPNSSPWIKQLKRTRPAIPLQTNLKTDIAIVGGGIAGVVTAYFTLKNTDKNVVLVEADMIAHGATGHNAGQITSYFERPLSQLIEEFGFEKAIAGQRDVESAWPLLDQIFLDAKLKTPIYKFTGYAGCTTKQQVYDQLAINASRVKGGLPAEIVIISKEADIDKQISKEYEALYKLAPSADILSLLETNNREYIALLAYQKGCMNSALFTEELIGYLSAQYKGRFSFFEKSPVKQVELSEHHGILHINEHTVQAKRIVLCTNGFSNFTILNKGGAAVDTAFHHLVHGRIGYMTAYTEPVGHAPIALSYLSYPHSGLMTGDPTGEPYFLMTRRPHEDDKKDSHNLICAAGPEKVLPNQAIYSRDHECEENVREVIDDFLKANYKHYPKSHPGYEFCWHGLMGYTPNGVRRIGLEPCNPVLMYNLGCNGVGILPSIYGGLRIARILKGEKVEASIFDPLDNRCAV